MNEITFSTKKPVRPGWRVDFYFDSGSAGSRPPMDTDPFDDWAEPRPVQGWIDEAVGFFDKAVANIARIESYYESLKEDGAKDPDVLEEEKQDMQGAVIDGFDSKIVAIRGNGIAVVETDWDGLTCTAYVITEDEVL